ncbi:Ribosomal protein L33 [Bacillus subtilis QB928]|nr:Ribosomal protein L33 [Bacillus subtilis QB928]
MNVVSVTIFLKRTNATIQTALNLKNIAHVIKNLRYTVKQNNSFAV